MKFLLKPGIAVAALCATALPSSASLIYLGTTPGSVPDGVGNSAIVLSLQSPGNATVEFGTVAAPGPTCTGDTQSPCKPPSNDTPSFASAGVTTPASLRIFLDAQEPDQLITLNALTMTVYTSNGATALGTFSLDTSTLPAGGNLPTCSGQGNNCVSIFGLNAAEQLQLQNLAGNNSFSTSWIIGLSGNLSSATGGPDRFFLGNVNSPIVTPEPSSLLMLGTGVLGAAGMMRRRFVKA